MGDGLITQSGELQVWAVCDHDAAHRAFEQQRLHAFIVEGVLELTEPEDEESLMKDAVARWPVPVGSGPRSEVCTNPARWVRDVLGPMLACGARFGVSVLTPLGRCEIALGKHYGLAVADGHISVDTGAIESEAVAKLRQIHALSEFHNG